ncbi:hypothetical protein FACS1894176_06070 [Bacteroidia bacterium]|nr:hypothetical protein FACS1894176_06070 [Bacteroidia bacterium]
MKVYHGSDTPIEEIDLEKCKYGKDFGRGFYITKFKEQAETMSARVSKWSKSKPVVTEFDFDEFAQIDNELKILVFDDYTDEWFDFVILNRRNKEKRQVHDYDIVEGPVANDKISTQIDDYLEGAITKEQFFSDLIHNPSHQICFCTVKSLQALTLAKGKIDSAIYHIDSDILQALMTDYGMTELEATDKYYISQTYSQLVDETTEFYKRNWQEIYTMLKKELNF